MSKRKYIGILIMSIFVSCVPLYAIGMETYSEEEVIEETIVHINPMYADEISEEELLHESTDYSDEYLADIKSVRSVSEMIEYVREQLKQETEKISYIVLNTGRGYPSVKFYEANGFEADESLVFMAADV